MALGFQVVPDLFIFAARDGARDRVGLMFLATLVLATAVTSMAPAKLAAQRLESLGVTSQDAQVTSTALSQQLVNEGLSVTTSSELAAVLGLERQKQLLGCASDQSACLTELANALGVDGLVTGSLARVGDGYRLDVKIVAAADARHLGSDTVTAATMPALLGEMEGSAGRLAEQVHATLGIAPDPHTPRALAANGRRMWWAAAGGLAAGATGAFFGYRALRTAELREREPSGPSYEALHQQVQLSSTFANISYGVAAVGAAAATYFWFNSRPVHRPSVAFAPGPGGAVLVVDLAF